MSAIPVSDTIAEIMERMSSLSLRGFGHNITENIKHLLTTIKEKCSGPEKLHLSDPSTREWVGQVTKLFYLVDDLSDHCGMLSACNLKPLLKLKQIEKLLLRELAPMKNVKMLPNRDAEEEEAEELVRSYVKRKIVQCVLEEEKGVNIRAIVIRGITGLGKGRAAKYVCEDEKVKSRFDVVVWIDALHLENHYADSVVNRVNLEKLSGAGKDFILILDDFHNRNHQEWLQLVKKLKEVAEASGGSGVILVTTRSKSVLQFVDNTFHRHRFDRLSRDESRILFQQITAGIGTETRDVDALLDLCGGILGAIETMARLVRCRKSDINELKDEFFQEMLLRYYSELDLPSWRLRQCFAYCFFLFSTPDDSLRPDKLVKLWMAEGFLGHSCSSHEPEDLGHQIIKEFLCRSIFRIDEDGKIISLYRKGGMAERFVLGNNHVDVGRVLLSLEDIPRSFLKSNKKMSTFVLKKQSKIPNRVMLSWSACDDILTVFTELRVLTLKDLGMKVLPASIGDLKSLRFLNLSRNNFKRLPTCIGELNHLQTLQLSHCLMLIELPDSVNYFGSLRHLEVDECPNLRQMPAALKKLTRVRSLPHFVTSKRNGLGELVHLNEVRRELEISHLERLKLKGSSSPQEHAYLKEKQHLEGLTLRWNHDNDDDGKDYEIMLKQLEPHQNLKRFSIIGYQGNQFPSWFSALNFDNLVEITLRKCSKCQSLSTLDHILVNLEKLALMSLESLEFITDNGNKDLRLKQVQILDCPKLTSWWKDTKTQHTIAFTAISELVVEYCPKLATLPLFPMLDCKLVLDCVKMEVLLNTLRHTTPTRSDPSLSKLNHLTMMSMDEKQYPSPEEKLLKNLISLSSLDIKNCKALNVIRGWKHLSSLQFLNITNCTGIDLPSDEWEGLENLEHLIIEDVPDMTSLPQGIKYLTNLDNLEIRSCPNLKTVPNEVGEALDFFTTVVFDDCPKLASLPISLTSKFLGLKVGNCPLLESLNHRIPNIPQQAPDIPQQAPDIQEVDQNVTATDIQEKDQNLTPPISNTENQEIQNTNKPSTDSRRCHHCESWIIRS